MCPAQYISMAVAEILPAHLRFCHDKVCIQIAVRLLNSSNQVDNFIRSCFQLRIRLHGQRVGDCFQPLGQITVLEYAAVVSAFDFPGGNPVVPDYMTGADIRNLIMQNLLLYGIIVWMTVF